MTNAGTPANELSPRYSRWSLAALAAITLAGLALRLTNISESLWLDELHTGWVVKDAWSDVAWRAQIGNQSPVWFYAVKVITTLGGESELTLRLLSLVAGTALIPAVYLLVCHGLASAEAPTTSQVVSDSAKGSTTGVAIPGLLGASLIAVDPNCIFYATEARPYACLQLCAAVQLGLFWQILQAPTTKLRISWMLLTALAFHLHYTGILILLGELVVLLGYYLFCSKPVPYRPWRALFDWQITAMLCLPAIGHVLEVGRRREMWDSTTDQASWSSFFALFSLHSTLALGLITCTVAIVRLFRGENTVKTQAKGIGLETVACWFLAPVLGAFAALAVVHLDLALPYLRRYLIAFAIGPPLLTALLLSRIPRRALQWLLAAAVLAFAAYESKIVPQLRYDGRAVADRNEDWRSAIAALNGSLTDEPLPVVISAGLIEEKAVHHHNDYSPETPISDQVRLFEYLSFPLRSCYDLDTRGLEIKSVGEWESGVVALPIEEMLALEPPRIANVWLIERSGKFDAYNRGVAYVRTRSKPSPTSYGTVRLGKARALAPVVTSPQSQSSDP